MPLISRSDCELNAYDRTFFVVDVTFAYDPGDFPGGGWFGAITNCCRVSADDDRVGIRLEAWDDVPEEQREPWADVASGVFRSETGEICAVELYTDVQDGFLILGEPDRDWHVRAHTRTDDEADPREEFLFQFWPAPVIEKPSF
ncbi:hypothetical protein [Streptosporangium sp. NPDC002607]